MRFYSIFWKIIIFILILFGIMIVLDSKQSLSIYRLVIFGLLPILLSITLFLLKKNKQIVIIGSNLFIISFIVLAFSEIYLIYIQNNSLSINQKIEVSDLKNKQTCGNSFKKVSDLTIYPVGGISKKKIKYINTENLSFSYRNNDRYGFNNIDEVWDLENIDTVFIGDSFTRNGLTTWDSIEVSPDFSNSLTPFSNSQLLNETC